MFKKQRATAAPNTLADTPPNTPASSPLLLPATRLDYLLALLSGTLYFLSFPPNGFFLCAWLFLLPLLYALKNKSVKDAARLGFAAGFWGNLCLMYWVTHSVYVYGGIPLPVSILIMLLLVGYLAGYFAVFACLASRLGARLATRSLISPMLMPCGLAALWVALEYVRANMFSGFPWLLIAYSQVTALPIIQVADITGIYGVSFVIIWLAAALYALAGIPGRIAIKVFHATTAFLLIAALLGYGYWRLGSLERAMANSAQASVPIALLQGNIPQDLKWEPSYQIATIHKYRALSRQSDVRGGIMVFPEAAMPFFLQDDGIYKRLVTAMVKESGGWGLIGALAHDDDGGFTVSNSAFVVSPAGNITERYDKVHLVPFGEYVPRYIPFTKKLTAVIGDIKSGNRFSPVSIASLRAGVLICYEAIFPEIARAYAMQSVDVLINITNDGWFGHTAAPAQHLTMARLRAVETRCYLLRAANTGISALIAPTGEIIAQTDLFVAVSLAGKIRPIRQETLHTRYGGNWFAYACFAFLLVLCLAGELKNGCRRGSKSRKKP